jgi:hypothetical protein
MQDAVGSEFSDDNIRVIDGARAPTMATQAIMHGSGTEPHDAPVSDSRAPCNTVTEAALLPSPAVASISEMGPHHALVTNIEERMDIDTTESDGPFDVTASNSGLAPLNPPIAVGGEPQDEDMDATLYPSTGKTEGSINFTILLTKL